MENDPFFAMTDVSLSNQQQPAPLPPSSNSALSPRTALKQRCRSADALDLLKDGSIFDNNVSPEEPVVATVSIAPPAATTNNSVESQQQENLDEAWNVLASLLQRNIIEQKHVTVFQSLTRDNVQTKEKVAKLKSLLARSAKAQKDHKTEMIMTKQKLDEANQMISFLHTRIDQLASRPTHYLDLVADFESNFDRALQAMEHNQQQQSGGTSSSETVHAKKDHSDYYIDDMDEASGKQFNINTEGKIANAKQKLLSSLKNTTANDEEGVTQKLLLSELEESKEKINKLESLNSALLHRASKVEKASEIILEQKDEMESKIAMMTAELRSAKAESDHLSLQLKENDASLQEMQMEIDLVTKASVLNSKKANESRMTFQKTDTKYVQDLEAKVTALTEWALASAEAKQLAMEHARGLETKLRELEQKIRTSDQNGLLLPSDGVGTNSKLEYDSNNFSSRDRKLWTEQSSLVVGAGMEGSYVVEYQTSNEAHQLKEGELILLRWKFDLTPSDMDICFSIYKGKYEHKKWDKADSLILNRTVLGGGGGDIEGAFAVQNACTLVWSNTHSWVRPRTVKFVVEVYAVTE